MRVVMPGSIAFRPMGLPLFIGSKRKHRASFTPLLHLDMDHGKARSCIAAVLNAAFIQDSSVTALTNPHWAL
jgi:hypothetical protein